MQTINFVMLQAYVGLAKETENGNMRLRVFTNESYQDSNDEWQEKTIWNTAFVNYGYAKDKARGLRKGDLVTIRGRANGDSINVDSLVIERRKRREDKAAPVAASPRVSVNQELPY